MGSSDCGFLRATATKVLSSVAKIASAAASETGRPKDNGKNNWGKRTVFLRGSTGKESSDSGFASIISSFSVFNGSPPL